MSKTIIVSNRLPIRITKEGEQLIYKTSEGGLATGLGSIYKQGDNVWVGWPGIDTEEIEEQQQIKKDIAKENMIPVFLTQEDISDYYEGFSNGTLWPLFHYFSQVAIYSHKLYQAYERVNKKFCDAVISVAKKGDVIWIQDYQLLLLPHLIREQLPQISIGFFLHIPFPSHEVFRLLPWRKELLIGILGSDLIGFHTYDDMRHFLSAVSRIAGLGNTSGKINIGNRSVVVDSFPMGIDYEKYSSVAASPETIKQEVKFRTSLGDQMLILSIDRLDYSKGIPQRLMAFEKFLEEYEEYRGRVSLIMVVVPSRDQVERYKMLKIEIDELVGRINGGFGKMNWTPIHYFYRSFPIHSLSALYRMADVALVTPMRDGMNLVCKEFIASKLDQKGVLILSEMAGASKELSDAILINPNNIPQMKKAIYDALTMPEEEQKHHISVMQETLKKFNIHHWVKLFMGRLNEIKLDQEKSSTKRLDQEIVDKIKEDYDVAKNRLLFLDYDGTLVDFTGDPEQAKPDKELMDLLHSLSDDPKNKVVIISGRKRKNLADWLDDLNLDMVAEHGTWIKKNGNDWAKIDDNLSNEWKKVIRPILDTYVNRTPGSFLEEKDFALVWHYRKVETGLGELRAREIISHLKYLTVNSHLQVLEGNMVVEIKNLDINKGKATKKFLKKYPYEFKLALGDDWTDEDTFKAMPENSYSIKVGSGSSAANYYITDYKEVRKLLKELVLKKI